MIMESIPAEGDLSMLEEIEEYFDTPISCPICGVEIDDYIGCGCYADIHWGKD